jgi:hypothetical protein
MTPRWEDNMLVHVGGYALSALRERFVCIHFSVGHDVESQLIELRPFEGGYGTTSVV